MRDPGAAPLYEAVGLAVTFATERGPLQAVRGVDLEIHAGTVVGLVGESGSGKSVTAQALLRLLPPHAQVTAPRLSFRGEDVVTMRPAALQRLRGGRVGMIFQEPARSFDPIYSIERSLAETLHTHRPELDPEALRARSVALLEEVGIAEAERRLASFPHQFSGGMLQRVMIAHALAADPEVLIADEPTTALDVTVQAQVVDLLLRLRTARGLAILFISHDLALVGQIADRLVVMYGGLVMEQGPASAVLYAPRHPYTRALLDAHLPLGVHYTEQPLHAIPGNVPDPLHPEPGCPFAPRCPLAEARCARAIPPLIDERVDAPAPRTTAPSAGVAHREPVSRATPSLQAVPGAAATEDRGGSGGAAHAAPSAFPAPGSGGAAHVARAVSAAVPGTGSGETERGNRAAPSDAAQDANPPAATAGFSGAGIIRHRCVLPGAKPSAAAVTPPDEERC